MKCVENQVHLYDSLKKTTLGLSVFSRFPKGLPYVLCILRHMECSSSIGFVFFTSCLFVHKYIIHSNFVLIEYAILSFSINVDAFIYVYLWYGCHFCPLKVLLLLIFALSFSPMLASTISQQFLLSSTLCLLPDTHLLIYIKKML